MRDEVQATGVVIEAHLVVRVVVCPGRAPQLLVVGQMDVLARLMDDVGNAPLVAAVACNGRGILNSPARPLAWGRVNPVRDNLTLPLALRPLS
jgi:hypothetical protein